MTTSRQTGDAMVRLRDAYPGLFTEGPEQWADRVRAFHSKLRRFDYETIREACGLAIEIHPARFPSAGQLFGLAKRAEDEARRKASEVAMGADRRREDDENAARVSDLRRSVIPGDRNAQIIWISDGKDQYDRLARSWECESKNLNLDPNRPSPPEIAKRRMEELGGLLDQCCFGAPVQRTGHESGQEG